MQSDPQPDVAVRAEAAHVAIRRFLANSRHPVLLEPGDPAIPITTGSFDATFEDGRLTIQAWDRERTLTRRITRVLQDKPGVLELETERFGKKIGSLQLLDDSIPQTAKYAKKGERQSFREIFRRSLARQYPSWHIAEITTEADLQRSLSPAYPRALLRKGTTAVAAIGAPDSGDVDGVLAFGLIWLDYVIRRDLKTAVKELAIFVPAGRHRTTCLRVRHLRRFPTNICVYVHAKGFEEAVDLDDYGNLDTELAVATLRDVADDPTLDELLRIEGSEVIESVDGELSVRVRGIEFARRKAGEWRFGLETVAGQGSSNLVDAITLAKRLSIWRSVDADRNTPVYLRNPELWLESAVRQSMHSLDSTLLARPVYGQVPAFAGGDRGVIDLLACDVTGRLAVIELKADEDLQLPLQALDYWIRVNWHVQNGQFSRQGYFRGHALSRVAPRLLLVAPSLAFHPTTERVLQFFPAAIDVERIGVNMDWRRELSVAFRLQGSECKA